jgi:hypothetical protein
MNITSRSRVLSVSLTVAAAAMLLVNASAAAEGASSQLGAADFRSAPVLSAGGYTDTAVPEEVVWYAFRTSRPEQTVSASAAITDPQIAERLGVTLSIVGPDLAVVAESATGSLRQALTFSQTGEGRSTTWYLTVRTSNGGSQLADAAVPLAVSLEGVDAADVEPCVAADGCQQAADAERLAAEIETAEASLDAKAAAAQPTTTPMSEQERLQLHERRRELTEKINAHNPEPPSPRKGAVLGAALISVIVGYFGAMRLARLRLPRPQLLRLRSNKIGRS